MNPEQKNELEALFLALTQLPPAGISREKKIHRLRVLGKKIRALLKLFRPFLGKEKAGIWNRKLSQTAKVLGASRNAKILRQLLGKISRDHARKYPFPEPTLTPDRQMSRALLVLNGATRLLLRKALPQATPEDLRHEVKKSRKKMRKCRRKARNHISGVRLHAWRKSIKRYLYQLELVSPDSKTIPRLRKTEKKLGRIHDLDELKTFLKNSSPLSESKKVLRHIQQRQRKHAGGL